MTQQTLLTPHETYTPGHTKTAVNYMSARTAESHAAFFLPYISPGDDLLDCGCGPGTITFGLADAAFPGQVFGLDLNNEQLEPARTMAANLEIVNVRFVSGTAYEMPFRDARFDAVFSHALLEHLSHPEEALREAYRVLRPGGAVGFCTPDWDHFHVEPCPGRVQRALLTYRQLQENNGGNTRAGALLPRWMEKAGFERISAATRFEIHEDPAVIANYLAFQLEREGEHSAAKCLREWGTQADASFAQAWCGVVAFRPE